MLQIGTIQLDDYPLLLAPMEDVSDPPFRFVCKENGVDMMYSEFISSEGLIRDAAKSIQKLHINDKERPVGIQIFGHDEDSMRKAAQIAETVCPDLIDINFGCPVKKVVCKGAGAGVLQDIARMVKLTEAVVKATRLPVTVKTRLGWDENSINIMETSERLQDAGIKALTIHARTKTQMYKGNADWAWIGKVKHNPRLIIPVFGNGDITFSEQAKEMFDKHHVDGIMLGRAAIGNPWIFREIKHYLKTGEMLHKPNLEERISTLKKHLEKSIEWKGGKTGILEMRKHYSGYFKGFENFREYRIKLVTSETIDAIYSVLDEIKEKYKPD